VRAYLRNITASARREAGFGMVELLCAMGVLAVGILAVFALFEAGVVNIKRASTITTAAALADTEMEKFRAVKYNVKGLADADANLLVDGADSTYQGDAAYRAVSSPANQLNSAVVLGSTTYSPTRTATGADGKSYRVDTYMTWHAVQNASGRPGRNV
jgi:Tfp pilus assembly protein PilV